MLPVPRPILKGIDKPTISLFELSEMLGYLVPVKPLKG